MELAIGVEEWAIGQANVEHRRAKAKERQKAKGRVEGRGGAKEERRVRDMATKVNAGNVDR